MAGSERLGKYRLLRRLAVGGMAEIYLAVAEGLSGFEKRVVVKRLLPQHARDPEVVAMFVDEARLLAGMRHPRIAEVYDVGREGDDYFFAMEHVAGTDVRDLLDARDGDPLPLAAALTIVVAIADGLHHAHEHRDANGRKLNVVHRDVTPSNVLLGRQGEIKLADFGVAKWSAQRSETRHGTLKGKVSYMSPEQCRAEPLDRRSDVFALGVMLYEITTGRRPFEAESDLALLRAIVAGDFAPPSRVRADYPPGLEAIVVRALGASRQERHDSAAALARDIRALAAKASLVLSSDGVAALVAEVAGADDAQDKDEAGMDGSDERADAGNGARDRTATDYSAAAPPAPQADPPLAPATALQRGAVRSTRARVGAGLALALAIGGLIAFAFREPPSRFDGTAGDSPDERDKPDDNRPAARHAWGPAAPAAGRPVATAPDLAPAQPASARSGRHANESDRAGKRFRSRPSVSAPSPVPPDSTPVAAPTPPPPTVERVWDPDSPLPPSGP